MNSELKYLVKPGLFLVTLIFLSVLVISFGYKQIYLLYTEINQSKETKRLLTLKLEILESVDEVLAEDINFLNVALPNKDVVLYGMSQVKKLALANNVFITNLKTSPQGIEDGGITKNVINIEIEGDEAGIYTFLNSIYKTLPLMGVDKLKINNTEGVLKASVTVNVYAAPLPEKIPALAEGVDGFTNEDILMLNKLSEYTLPDFFNPEPSEGSIRDDPFR